MIPCAFPFLSYIKSIYYNIREAKDRFTSQQKPLIYYNGHGNKKETAEMKTLWTLAKRYHAISIILMIIFGESIITALNTVSVQLWKNIIVDLSMVPIITYFAVLVIETIGRNLLSRLKQRTTIRLSCKYQQDMFDTAIMSPMKELQEFSMGDMVTGIQSARDVMHSLHTIPSWLFAALVNVVVTITLMMLNSIMLSLVILVEIIPIGIAILLSVKKVNSFDKARKEAQKGANRVVNRLSTFLPIKSFSAEKTESSLLSEKIEKFRTVSVERINSSTMLGTVVRIGLMIMDATIVIFGIKTHDIGTMIVFGMLTNSLIQPICNIQDMLYDYSMLKIHIEANNKILDMEKEFDGEVKLSNFNDSIEFKSVSFSYNDSDEVLKNINLVIPKGKRVGIYGESGSGKSSMMNLLTRFFTANSGEILIDGININEFTKSSLRRHIGVVNQDVQLFSDMTVKENIAYGLPGCTDAQIVEAAKKAYAHQFIEKLPNGYDSKIGNNGVKLSGGEAQRISLARLLILNPDIIILDEATSKLDNASEEMIKKAIDNLSKDKTVISIAHRFTTIEDCDILIGIKNHTIYETGTKETLDVPGTLFHELYK